MTNLISHGMLDLETMGTGSNAAIVAIGAIIFTKDDIEVCNTFYSVISLKSTAAGGGLIDASTVEWWMNQSDEARSALFGKNIFKNDLIDVLYQFQCFVKDNGGKNLRMWGNGSDFDNVILSNAYKANGSDIPWNWFNNRCYRTIKNTFKDIKLDRVGTHHNALDDAESQARHLIEIANQYDLDLK